jgi:hypothetical protein
MKKNKLKQLNQKDIDRFHQDLADFLGVRRHGGCLSKQESDEKTDLFFEIMKSLQGKLLFRCNPNSHELNVKRHIMHKAVFVRNPAYYCRIYESEPAYMAAAKLLDWCPPNQNFNDRIFIVPEENVETVLLFGFPNISV